MPRSREAEDVPPSGEPTAPWTSKLSAFLITVAGVAGVALVATGAESVARDSTDALGFQGAITGAAAGLVLLLVLGAAGWALSRRLDVTARVELARISAWTFLAPGAVWTAIVISVTGSDSGDSPQIGEILPEITILAAPLFVASAALFAFARRHD